MHSILWQYCELDEETHDKEREKYYKKKRAADCPQLHWQQDLADWIWPSEVTHVTFLMSYSFRICYAADIICIHNWINYTQANASICQKWLEYVLIARHFLFTSRSPLFGDKKILNWHAIQVQIKERHGFAPPYDEAIKNVYLTFSDKCNSQMLNLLFHRL